MTANTLAAALREAEQRRIAEMSDEELIRGFNTCADCGAPMLSHGQLAVVIAQADSLEEFYELFPAFIMPSFFWSRRRSNSRTRFHSALVIVLDASTTIFWTSTGL
jgi:hypothetical protein